MKFATLANEISHVYDYAELIEHTSATGKRWPKRVEFTPTEEVNSNKIENKARKMFPWMLERETTSRIGVTFETKKEARQFKRTMKTYSKKTRKRDSKRQ